MLSELVKKEIKNTFRDKKVVFTAIIMPLIIFAIMGLIYSFAFSKTGEVVEEQIRNASVFICDNDNGGLFTSLALNYSHLFAKKVEIGKGCGEDYIKKLLLDGNYTVGVIIPAGASQNLTLLKPVEVKVIGKVSGFSFSSMAASGIVSAYSQGLNSFIRAYIISNHGLDPKIAISPVKSVEAVIFREALLPPSSLASLSMVFFMFMLAPLMVISTSLGVAASSMAVENEEKTLEVLLSLPVSRFKILLSKLGGTMVLVTLSTISFVIGFIIYISAIGSGISMMATGEGGFMDVGGDLITSVLNLQVLAGVGIATFLSLTAVASLGILLGSLAPDTRTASSYIGQLSFLIIIPGFILTFLDLSSFNEIGQALMVAVSPFIAPVLLVKAYFEGLYYLIPVTMIWALAFSLIMILVASKLLNSEKLLSLQYWFLTRKKGKKSKKKVGEDL